MNTPTAKKCAADINVLLRVYFDDDGENDVTDQAMEAAKDAFSLDEGDSDFMGIELVGKPFLRSKAND